MSMTMLVLVARSHINNRWSSQENDFGNLRITIREIAGDVGIPFDSCLAIFTDVIAIKRSAVQTASKLLYFELKQRRIDIAQKMLTTFYRFKKDLEEVNGDVRLGRPSTSRTDKNSSEENDFRKSSNHC